MRNIAVIVRRELTAYYQSAIGYIFLFAFITLGSFLYVFPFFLHPTADMRDYFNMLPFFLCILIPAVTMRSWAEERKENTLEMLLTFPMRVRELVLGKFLSSLLFFVAALACTLTIPVMIGTLGRPDWGPIICSYFGTILLGAFFLSMGLFFSGLCQDQIVAFLISVIACFFLYLAGTDFVSAPLDGWWNGLGTFLSQVVGVADHYSSFGRGVLEIGDLLYFGGWTAIFLVLNWMYLEGRSRPGHHSTFAMAAGLIVAIGLAGNWIIAGESLGRHDLTADSIYTISPATQRILAKLKVPVQVKVYITPSDKMPTEMKALERDLLDKLDEMRIAAHGNLEFRAIHMEAANALNAEDDEFGGDPRKDKEGTEKKDDVLEKRLLEKGVRPFPVRALREDQTVTQMIYSAIGIAYKEQKEEILPQIMPEMMEQFEYLMVNTIYKLTRETRPKVALVAPVSEMDPRLAQLYAQMGRRVQVEDPFQNVQRLLQSEKYDVSRVTLSPEEPLPDGYDTLVILNPKGFNARQKWEIARALHGGRSVFLAVQNYTWDYRVKDDSISAVPNPQNPELDDLLKHYGLGVDPAILMDHNHITLQVSDPSNPFAQMAGRGIPVDVSSHILVEPTSMNPKHAISSHMETVLYLWGAALTLNDKELKEKGLDAVTLMSSSDKAWSFAEARQIGKNREMPADTKRFPLAALVSGQFPDPYAGQERPKWPAAPPPGPGEPMPRPTPEDKPSPDLPAKPAKLLLVGCAEMFKDNFLMSNMAPGNLDLLLNSIDAMTMGNDILEVRGKKRIDRTMDKPTPWQSSCWKFGNLGLVNLLVVVVGIGGALRRRRSREAYTLKHSA